MSTKTIATFDYETDPFKVGRSPEPFSCGFYDGQNYWDFWGDDCTLQFMLFLYNSYIPDYMVGDNLIIYAHNGGKFDFFYLLDYLDPELFMINGRIGRAYLTGARFIEFRDSYLILPLPLSANDKDSISYDKFERDVREDHKDEILKYQKKDCTSLHEWVSGFAESYGTGLTIAGTAFKELKKLDYKVKNTSDEYDRKFRPFYYGGRVQCFETGHMNGWFECVDINSAYPWAMTKDHWHGDRYMVSSSIPDTDNGSWFIECDAISKGALPIRGEDGKLYYPDDDTVRRYRVTGWEINAGLDTETLQIVKIHSVFVPNNLETLKPYVDKFFGLKSEADKNMKDAKAAGDDAQFRYWKAQRLFSKTLSNSCYGKFGQDGRKFEKFEIYPWGESPAGDGWKLYSETSDHAIYSRPDPADRFFNVATAASITGCVRAYLWRSICASDRPLYCDTDSIICQKFHGEIGDELGQWECEARGSDVYIAQRKMYAMKRHQKLWPFFDYKIASKGVRLTAQQIIDGVTTGKTIVTERDAPAFSLKQYKSSVSDKFGSRFFTKKISFKNIEKNACTIPPEIDSI